MAEQWGVPPWVVADAAIDEGKRAWYWRQVAWDRARDKRAEIEAKRAMVKRG